MELDELRLQRTKLQQELTALKQQVREAEQIKSQRDQLETALAESKTTNSDLETMLSDMEREKNIASKHLEQSRGKVKECENAMVSLQEDCAVVKNDLISAEKRISELEALLEVSENRVQELEHDYISTKERNLVLETGYGRIREIESGLRDELVSLHKRATISEKDLAEKRNQIEILERGRDEDGAKFEKLRKEYEDVARELQELKSMKSLDTSQVNTTKFLRTDGTIQYK